MRLPRLLNADGSERARLHPVKLSATINKTPLSVSNMVVLAGNDIFVRDFVEIYKKDKSLGIFRVSSVGRESKGTQNINLSHGIATLEDSVTPAETTVQGTLSAVVATLLGYQKGTARWAVGSVPNEGAYKLEVDRTNLLQAFCDICKQARDYVFRCDQTTTPWKINAYPVASENLSECRISRNASSPRMTIDESDLCTRVVAPQLDNGYMDADTVDTWGIVERDLGVPDDSDAAEVKKYAAEVLEARKNPAISVEIDAFELSDRTGDPIDRFEIGYRCRVAMADIGISVLETIETLYYGDLLASPDIVIITLANKPRDVSKSLASLANQTSGLTSTVTKYGSSIRGNSAAIDDNKQFIIRDREIIDLHTKTIEEQGLVLKEAEIQLGDAKITLEAHQQTLTEQGKRLSSAEIRLDGAEANILLKVDKDGVISAINLSPEAITIQAAKINLEGYVTATQLSTEIAAIKNSFSDMVSTKVLYAQSTFQYQGWTVGLSENKFVTSVRFPTLSSQRISRLIDDDAYVVVGYAQNGSYSSDDYRYLSY